MQFLQGLWQQYAAAHPLYSHCAALLIGGFVLPRLVAAAEAALPKAVDWLDARQENALRKLGLSEEQILVIKQHEVDDLRKSADELQSRIDAAKVAPKG